MLAFADNPPLISPGIGRIAEIAGPWWIAHTKARCEKAFASDLVARNIAYFLPMLERVHVSGGRRRRVMDPLFPSYVFFSGDAEARYRAVSTGRLCQVLRVADQAKLVAELGALHWALEGRAPLDPYPHAVIGRRCRITAGPFCGLEGTVVRRDGRTRIVLQVGILGRGAAMEIHPDLLESAESSEALLSAAI
jgi:transcription antitermination factor NusG